MKNLLLICMIQLVCAVTFAQEPPEPDPGPQKKQESVIEKKEPDIYDVVDEQAEFPGGKGALMKYISENLKYPQSAVEMELQGKCYLQFVVSEKGDISNVRVRKGIADCPECDREAIRLVKTMPKWKPAKVGGKAVNSLYTLPVIFKLN